MQEFNINDALGILGLKPASKRVLLCLIENISLSAADIASTLNLPKSSVYDAIAELVKQSIVTENSDERGRTFSISDNDQLLRVHDNKIDELKSAQKALSSYISNHSKEESVERPKIKFYSGMEGVRQAFRDMPWSADNKEAYLMWPMSNMLERVGEDFLQNHSKGRFKYKVMLRSIRKESDKNLVIEGHEWLASDTTDNLREVRYAPKDIDWEMSYWIYGNRCLFASSGKEGFAFVINSKEFASLMKLLWKQVWRISKI